MNPFPLRYARRNVLIGRSGEAAALYRLDTLAYPFLPVAEKWALLHRLERLAQVVGADFSLWRVNRSYPAERYAAELAALADPDHANQGAWGRYLTLHAERLAQLGSHTAEVYLAVALSERPVLGFAAALIGSIDRRRRRVEELAGVSGARPLRGAELSALAAVEQRTFERLGAVVGLRRTSTRELQWLLCRAACRGIGEPALDGAWKPDALVVRGTDDAVRYEPLEADLWRCANAPLSEDPAEPPSLQVEAEEGTSFQAFLSLGSLADESEFPGAGAELLFAPLEGSVVADAVLHARFIANREALAQIRKRILDTEHAYREQELGTTAGAGYQTEENRVLAREYEAVLESSAHPPMLRASISLAVGAPERSELESRVEALREEFGEVALHRPRGLQEQLFFDHLPRADCGATTDYEQQMSVEQFGALVPTATTQLGSPHGIYIGHSTAARPVFYDPTEASRTSRPSAVLLAGTLGSGKTLTGQTLAFGAERRGSLVVDFDPKPDHGLDRVPELEGSVEVLELSGAEANRGKLDPLAIGLPELREELACSYLLELLRDPSPAWENAIGRAVRDSVRAGESGLLGVIERLRGADAEAAQEAGDALEVIADFGLARLGFGAGEGGVEVSAEQHSVITIRTPGLTLPEPGASRETYTRAERVSVATLSLVAALALRLISGERTRHKFVLLDEAWFLLVSSQGRSLLNRLIRLGRAFNATIVLATQRLADLGELSDLIGVYCFFGLESDAEAASALAQLGLDPEDSLRRSQLKEFRQGRCLMRDLDGRVGEMQVDLVSEELLAALDSTPAKAARA